MSTNRVVGTDGTELDLGTMPHTLGYTAGLLTTDTVTDGTNSWVQTLTYTAGTLTGTSRWVKQ